MRWTTLGKTECIIFQFTTESWGVMKRMPHRVIHDSFPSYTSRLWNFLSYILTWLFSPSAHLNSNSHIPLLLTIFVVHVRKQSCMCVFKYLFSFCSLMHKDMAFITRGDVLKGQQAGNLIDFQLFLKYATCALLYKAHRVLQIKLLLRVPLNSFSFKELLWKYRMLQFHLIPTGNHLKKHS